MSAVECAEYNAKIDREGQAEADLAIWWEAYREAIHIQYLDTDFLVMRIAGMTPVAGMLADLALAAYKAKAAELRGKE